MYFCNIVKLNALNGHSTSLAVWLSQEFESKIYEYVHNPACDGNDYLPHKAIADERRILANEEDESESLLILRILGTNAI